MPLNPTGVPKHFAISDIWAFSVDGRLRWEIIDFHRNDAFRNAPVAIFGIKEKMGPNTRRHYATTPSPRSACASGSAKASSTLLSIGLKEEIANKTVRISIGKQITDKNIRYLVDTLKEIIH